MVATCNTRYNVKSSFCCSVYLWFHMTVTNKAAIIYQNTNNRLVFVLDTVCVLCEVRIESVNIIYTDVRLQMINVGYFTDQSQINHFTQ